MAGVGVLCIRRELWLRLFYSFNHQLTVSKSLDQSPQDMSPLPLESNNKDTKSISHKGKERVTGIALKLVTSTHENLLWAQNHNRLEKT